MGLDGAGDQNGFGQHDRGDSERLGHLFCDCVGTSISNTRSKIRILLVLVETVTEHFLSMSFAGKQRPKEACPTAGNVDGKSSQGKWWIIQ